MGNTHERTVGLLKSGLIAALYVVITVALIPWSFGPVQLRLAEMLNNLAVFNKRYIWALTLGCLIANLWSSLGAVDVIFGSLGTLMMTGVSYLLSRYTESVPRKLVISVISCTVLTWSVALEMFFVSHIPFWATYLSVAIGELISMIIGAVAFWLISLRIDLTK
ncbi:QueT transporter family protein [Liquorilactobacillus uvarum]|uniref:QueT transporter family protein n=1 Tax=Liquorilactobacillus uvarum TaxID=303240 RepID=UPI00288BDF92|nr:QueT transporter family protein [Liquorilactobacillus uvarum]